MRLSTAKLCSIVASTVLCYRQHAYPNTVDPGRDVNGVGRPAAVVHLADFFAGVAQGFALSGFSTRAFDYLLQFWSRARLVLSDHWTYTLGAYGFTRMRLYSQRGIHSRGRRWKQRTERNAWAYTPKWHAHEWSRAARPRDLGNHV